MSRGRKSKTTISSSVVRPEELKKFRTMAESTLRQAALALDKDPNTTIKIARDVMVRTGAVLRLSVTITNPYILGDKSTIRMNPATRGPKYRYDPNMDPQYLQETKVTGQDVISPRDYSVTRESVQGVDKYVREFVGIAGDKVEKVAKALYEGDQSVIRCKSGILRYNPKMLGRTKLDDESQKDASFIANKTIAVERHTENVNKQREKADTFKKLTQLKEVPESKGEFFIEMIAQKMTKQEEEAKNKKKGK